MKWVKIWLENIDEMDEKLAENIGEIRLTLGEDKCEIC